MSLMKWIDFLQAQLPVGQGGFHIGCLLERRRSFRGAYCDGAPLFVWVYDCGSDQLSVLESQIRSVSGIRINMLFLSHLDEDHVVGVDKLLLTASEVQEVVLPYLNDEEWALHLASGASRSALSGTFIDLVASPADWFGARGVKRITYVEANGEEGEGPDGPDPTEPSGEGALSPDGIPQPLQSSWSREMPQATGSTGRAEILRVPAGAVAPISGAGGELNWVLSPFAFRPSDAKLTSFASELSKEFGAALKTKDYADAARTEVGRKKLRACYDAVWKTHNLHSMALYAGPSVGPAHKLRCTAWQGSLLRQIVQPGWLSTGDFDLSVKKRREKFRQYYARYSSMIGQLTLPHHGSDHSFHASILSALPELTFGIAAVGANGHGHPGRGVQAAVDNSAKGGFVRVDENKSSRFAISGQVKS